MTKNEMLDMLHALDAELKAPLQIVITGASALIIRGCISRSSNDIDVLTASDHLNHGPLKEIVNKQLDDDALNMRISYQKAIIDIDNAALSKLVKSKSKDADYELSL